MALNVSIRELAKKKTTLFALGQNRDKLETKELIDKYPHGVHITDVECFIGKNDKGEEEPLWVYVTEEEPEYFSFAGYVLRSIFEELLACFEGDYEAMYKEFKEEGGLNVRLYKQKTKSGYEVTAVEVL